MVRLSTQPRVGLAPPLPFICTKVKAEVVFSGLLVFYLPTLLELVFFPN